MAYRFHPLIDGTPWGPAQCCELIADGIWDVSTASHGGLIVDGEALASMPSALRRVGEDSAYHGPPMSGVAFEEDSEVAAVFLAFPDVFRPHSNGYEAARLLWAMDECARIYPEAFRWAMEQAEFSRLWDENETRKRYRMMQAGGGDGR